MSDKRVLSESKSTDTHEESSFMDGFLSRHTGHSVLGLDCSTQSLKARVYSVKSFDEIATSQIVFDEFFRDDFPLMRNGVILGDDGEVLAPSAMFAAALEMAFTQLKEQCDLSKVVCISGDGLSLVIYNFQNLVAHSTCDFAQASNMALFIGGSAHSNHTQRDVIAVRLSQRVSRRGCRATKCSSRKTVQFGWIRARLCCAASWRKRQALG